MRYLNLRNRIAFTYIAVTALLIAALFSLIYIVIFKTVYNHLDDDLDVEMQEVYSSIVVLDNVIIFSNPNEWTEKEHGQIEVNPTFIEIVDTAGNIIKRTPNLRQGSLYFNPLKRNTKSYCDTLLSAAPIRQLQVPIKNPTGKILAHLIIAIPLQESAIVLKNLRQTLLIGYPIVLIVLFLISRFIAGRSIAPINTVISTAEKITKENLNERIQLPLNKDEIYTLAQTINDLLDRLKDVVLREKQFTADASHELRTPLSVIKGTLEVLIRKPREREQYVEKIHYVISEVDRMSILVDQLLEFARFESGKTKPTIVEADLNKLIEDSFLRLYYASSEKNISLHMLTTEKYFIKADVSMMNIILENIISNAIKYSFADQAVEVSIKKETGKILCSISDHGSGIPEGQIGKIFDRFYRVDESRTSQIAGKGIGLAIVKRLAGIQHLEISVQSTPAVGTTFTIIFP
jgi:signal transduction histidine kinase